MKKRTIKLHSFPKHREMLTDIAHHFEISRSLALQLAIGYQGFFSVKKQFKRYKELFKEGDNAWINFDDDEDTKLSAYLRANEIRFTTYAKNSIKDFYNKMSAGNLDRNNKAIREYLS